MILAASPSAPLAAVGETFQNTVLSGPLLLAMGACLVAGLVSFASPCVVPLVPGYLSYLAGLVGAEAPAVSVGESPKKGRSRVALAAFLFVLGFTVVFVAATATVLGVTSTFVLNRELLQRIGGERTVVVVEHDMDFIGKLCDPVIVMAEGKVLAQGSADSIMQNEAVIEAYLGRGLKNKVQAEMAEETRRHEGHGAQPGLGAEAGRPVGAPGAAPTPGATRAPLGELDDPGTEVRP